MKSAVCGSSSTPRTTQSHSIRRVKGAISSTIRHTESWPHWAPSMAKGVWCLDSSSAGMFPTGYGVADGKRG
jgi:hypothetical protein